MSTMVSMPAQRHILSVASLTRTDVARWIERAESLRTTPRAALARTLNGCVIATLFYEPSTRTRLSFEAAAVRLGAHVVGAENALENSSAKKGESLEDVLRVVGVYADCIVIRHHEDDAVMRAAAFSPVPVISAGAGAGEHPTQALLDVYTIQRELGRVDGLRLTVIGDLRYGRTVHSLLRLMKLYSDIEVTVLHPRSLGLPDALLEELLTAGMRVRTAASIREALDGADVVYQTRIQKERLQSPEDAAGREQCVITPADMAVLPAHACVLHPLPRVDEIHPDVDRDPRAAYFRQVENGLFLRMALLETVVKGDDA